ncbi:helix-turn-helix transcriptional regulator [Bifidobacterium aquikefiri]|uniref:helix-turn-helix transcriptional regulator n=1 Tax=Bifidobacterium aquikefiri TaxID=1653207 RepID=UPI0023EFEACC|nr:AraC family transcriptional regulator [Bifidobacterium aquikefiri]
MDVLEVMSDMSEKVHYNITGLPVYSLRDRLRRYGYAAKVHWHPDLELIVVLSGIMQYSVNGTIVTIPAGHGIFINSRRLHFGFSHEHADCTFIATVIHPSLITACLPAAQDALGRQTARNRSDFYLLSPFIEWQEHLIRNISQLNAMASTQTPPPLEIVDLATHIGIQALNHVGEQHPHPLNDPDEIAFQRMSAFIERCHHLHITVQDIAHAGTVGRSACFQIFHRFTQSTPNKYLIDTRIRTSIAMLEESNAPISEIAQHCGFATTSHYSHTFKLQIGVTPTQYRDKHHSQHQKT